MAKLNFSIALNLLTQGIKHGVTEVEGYFKKLRSTITSTLGGLGIGLGITEFGRSMINAGKDFEAGMARVRAVTNASTEDFKAMEAEAKRLGGTTKYTASEAASALENLTRNGLTPTQATAALSKTLQLAQANAISLAEAADMATNTMNGFGMSVDELGKVNDILSSTAAHSATNVLELAEAVKNAAPLAKNCGVGIQETNAALGTLANVGIKGADAGTALKQVFMGLSTESDKGAKALKKYGLEINQQTIEVDGLAGTLKKLYESGIGKNNQDLADVFGRRAFSGAAALINNYEKFIELNDTLASSYGETERMFEQGSGRMENALASLSSAWEAFQIEIFQGGENLFVAPIEALTGFIRYCTENLGTLAAKILAIFAGVKVIQYFRQWQAAGGTAFMTMAAQAQAAHAKVNTLERAGLTLRKQIKSLEAQLEKASADQRLAIEVQLEAKKRQLKANELAVTKATEAAKAADAQAAAVKSATGWQLAMIKIKAAATTAAAAMKTIWSTVWPMLLMTVIVEVISKISSLIREAAGARDVIKNIEKEATQSENEQRAKIAALSKIVHDNTQAIKNRQQAIADLQKIVPDYHASLTQEGKLINDNTNALDAYCKKLKLAAQIQAASTKLADAEMQLSDFEKNASKGVSAAYFNERVMGMSENDAIREAGASPSGYRAFKAKWAKLQANVTTLNNYIEDKTKEMNAVVVTSGTGGTGGGGGGTGGTGGDNKQKTDLQKAQEDYTRSLRELDEKKRLELVTENEYQQQLSRLNEETLLRLRSSDDVAARESAFAKKLEAAVKADKSAKAARELADAEARYKETIAEADRKKANGALTEESYAKAVLAAQTRFIDQAAAIDGLTDEQKHTIQVIQKYRKALEVGAMNAELAKQPGRDKTFDYKLTADEIAKTEIEYQLEQAKKRLAEMKSLASDMTAEIEDQMKKVTSLDEALKLAKVREDVKALQKDLAKTEWNSVKDLASSTNTIVSAWTGLADTLSDEDASPWEKIAAIWNAMTQTVDGFLRIIDAVNAWTEASETLQKAQAAEAAMTQTTAAQKVAANTQAIASDQAAGAATVAKATTDVAANTASAASSAGASAAKLPFPANLLAVAAAISAVLGLMAAIPKFAGGGVVQGGSSINDLQLARVNAGEMILNGSQQKRLWNAINSDMLRGSFDGKRIIGALRGSTLYLLMENYKKQAKKP
ncbi:MAG: phage tail tape measure protein [Paludibacteraceae bacterium]|nr:phage tail tape measure protein [Paludibacteraceae bacterium]